ncbi:MAG: DNA alkylation repair protein [Lentimicrobiaceae bacterium]|nr:DNA alkylation repair protein [Lentimicrobiaceae bacterium]
MDRIENPIPQIRETLAAKSDAKTIAATYRFFKENETLKTYGVKAAEVGKIAKESFQLVKAYPKQTIFELCETLWQSGYLEEMTLACDWSESLHKQFEPADLALFEHWLSDYVSNWATCDTLCNHTIGYFLMKYPDEIAKLKLWTKSPNRWLRRGAAVSLIIPARKGLFLNDILEIADQLLLDKEDMVQKGYGWMLKAASMSESFVKGSDAVKKQHLEAVFNFVIKNKAIMPRTALRYAIEKMPEEMRGQAMVR